MKLNRRTVSAAMVLTDSADAIGRYNLKAIRHAKGGLLSTNASMMTCISDTSTQVDASEYTLQSEKLQSVFADKKTVCAEVTQTDSGIRYITDSGIVYEDNTPERLFPKWEHVDPEKRFEQPQFTVRISLENLENLVKVFKAAGAKTGKSISEYHGIDFKFFTPNEAFKAKAAIGDVRIDMLIMPMND